MLCAPFGRDSRDPPGREDILDRASGMEAILHALFLAKGRTDIALARIRVLADLLALKACRPPTSTHSSLRTELPIQSLTRIRILAADRPFTNRLAGPTSWKNSDRIAFDGATRAARIQGKSCP
jgi:hypothetical protein